MARRQAAYRRAHLETRENLPFRIIYPRQPRAQIRSAGGSPSTSITRAHERKIVKTRNSIRRLHNLHVELMRVTTACRRRRRVVSHVRYFRVQNLNCADDSGDRSHFRERRLGPLSEWPAIRPEPAVDHIRGLGVLRPCGEARQYCWKP
jgi:hypothetical protein